MKRETVRRNLSHRLLLAAVFALLVGSLSVSCGGSGAEEAGSDASEQAADEQAASGAAESERTKEPTELELVQLSERTTIEAGSARFAMDIAYPAMEGMPTSSMQMEGVQDFETGDGEFDMTMPVMPMEWAIENLIVDDVMYQRYPDEMMAAMASSPPPETEWVATDLEEQYEEQYGMSLSEMQNSAPETPADQLSYLRSVGSVERLGSRDLNGVETEHYRAVVDLDKELENLEGSPETTEYYRDLEEQLGTGEIPLDVWLDKEGRVRKQVMSFPMPDSVEGANGETTEVPVPEGEATITITYRDFGVPVDVSAPASETVISQEEFMSLAQGAS